MKIIQIDEGYTRDSGEGVHNVVTNWDNILTREGYETRIVSSVEELSNIYNNENDILYMYHAVSGVNPLIKTIRGRKVLVFHNISEPELLYDLDPVDSDFCAKGLYEISRTAEYFDYAVAFSDFSKECLIKNGWKEDKISTIPIMLRFDEYDRAINESIIQKYSDNKTNILFSGRIFPNKRQQDIIAAFSEYKKKYNFNARLFLVGKIQNKRFFFALKDYAKKLDVSEDVVFVGHTKFSEYLAYFKIADLFLCMSAHEGFCMPLVEAMYYDIPIIAHGNTAIPDTLGNAGVQIHTRNPIEIAGIIDEIVNDEEKRNLIITEQRKRFFELSSEKLEAKYSAFFKMLISKVFSIEPKEPIEFPSVLDYKSGFLDSKCIYRLIQSDSFDGWNGEIVIYGNGRVGKRLYEYIKKEDNTVAIYICDSNIGGAADGYVLSPEQAVMKHGKAIFLISVQSKNAQIEIMMRLGKLDISAEQIRIYNSQTGTVWPEG